MGNSDGEFVDKGSGDEGMDDEEDIPDTEKMDLLSGKYKRRQTDTPLSSTKKLSSLVTTSKERVTNKKKLQTPAQTLASIARGPPPQSRESSQTRSPELA
jgi:hypothetical protein